jgi:hypothetical protein
MPQNGMDARLEEADSGPETTRKEPANWSADVGLQFNPFQEAFFDAGADPYLPYYLVGRRDFANIWGDWPSFLFAPAGGGKTAFRVRLAYACRIGVDGRRIVPVIYKPRYAPGAPVSLDTHCHYLCNQAALELLLTLVHQPARYLAQPAETQQLCRAMLHANLHRDLDYYLDGLAGEPGPADKLAFLAEIVDPTATRLPGHATPDELTALCDSLVQSPGALPTYPDAVIRFKALAHFLRNTLGYQAVYILVDGVDAFYETYHQPSEAANLIMPLIEQIDGWRADNIYLKFFLHQELYDHMLSVLSSCENCVTIEWTDEMLVNLLRERLRAASAGDLSSFDDMGDAELSDTEQQLVAQLESPLPREALVLASRLLLAYRNRAEGGDKLSRDDLNSAVAHYQNNPV